MKEKYDIHHKKRELVKNNFGFFYSIYIIVGILKKVITMLKSDYACTSVLYENILISKT